MNRSLVVVVVALTAAFLAGCGDTGGGTGKKEDLELFNNGNADWVENGGVSPRVTFHADYIVTLITDYHWNYGNGQAPGTIALRSSDGTTYGPWVVTTRPGQGGVPNAYWDAHPMINIPAGTYTVIDSDPATWSQNVGSDGEGMVIIYASVE